MSNFKFLLSDPAFAPFMDTAMAAEKILHIDPAAAILNCRRAMEFAVKWMYSVDAELEMPYQDNLQSLMTREEFRTIVGPDIYARMDYIRMKGNHAAHTTGKISEGAAMLCLENLHIFLDFVVFVPFRHLHFSNIKNPLSWLLIGSSCNASEMKT